MQVGDLIKTDGYDVLASALYAEEDGEVVVLGNGSSHVLVASRTPGDTVALLERSYRYQESDFGEAYRDALARMSEIATER